jgi:hypothetical protein
MLSLNVTNVQERYSEDWEGGEDRSGALLLAENQQLAPSRGAELFHRFDKLLSRSSIRPGDAPTA